MDRNRARELLVGCYVTVSQPCFARMTSSLNLPSIRRQVWFLYSKAAPAFSWPAVPEIHLSWRAAAATFSPTTHLITQHPCSSKCSITDSHLFFNFVD